MARTEWDSSGTAKREYNALRDPNMRFYFENRSVQSHLFKTGQIDRAGRVIDLERNNNKSKLHIIEQELKSAEKLEFWRAEPARSSGKKEEDEMRYRVQQKRHDALDRIRRQERLGKMKEDRRIRTEIVAAARGAVLPVIRSGHQSSGTSFVTELPSRF
ncbi:hypothetical protein M885DRAFT_625008 [Pelagophyceae sp. CCMP2097]|nr:hypothetical protein M885DRAFT_625008 [Pelagophyceae sp. CCMP2097]